MSSNTLLATLFHYKAWANQELIHAISTVDALASPKPYRLAIRLLNHTYIVDCIFAAHINGEPHTFSKTNTPETPTLSELQDKIMLSDNRFIERIPTMSQACLEEKIEFVFTDGKAGCMSREAMLAHLITHGTYHRGQIGRILSELSVTAPRDVLTTYVHLDR